MTLSLRDSRHDGGEHLDGATKAALVLLAVEREKAVELLKRLEADEVRSIAQGAERLGPVNAGLLTLAIASFEASFREGLKFIGTAGEVRRLIVEAIGEEQVAAALAGAPTDSAHVEPWPELERISDDELRNYVVAQHPQIAAFILTKIAAERVAELVQGMDAALCSDVLSRMLSIGEPPSAIVHAIEEAVARDLLSDKSGAGGRMHQGLAAILNRLDQARTSQIIEELSQLRPADAKILQRMLFRFEDLLTLPPKSLTLVVERVPVERLVLALQQTTSEFQASVLGVMSARARRMAESELQSGVAANAKTIASARQFVVDAVLKLAASGAIEFAGTET